MKKTVYVELHGVTGSGSTRAEAAKSAHEILESFVKRAAPGPNVVTYEDHIYVIVATPGGWETAHYTNGIKRSSTLTGEDSSLEHVIADAQRDMAGHIFNATGDIDKAIGVIKDKIDKTIARGRFEFSLRYSSWLLEGESDAKAYELARAGKMPQRKYAIQFNETEALVYTKAEFDAACDANKQAPNMQYAEYECDYDQNADTRAVREALACVAGLPNPEVWVAISGPNGKKYTGDPETGKIIRQNAGKNA